MHSDSAGGVVTALGGSHCGSEDVQLRMNNSLMFISERRKIIAYENYDSERAQRVKYSASCKFKRSVFSPGKRLKSFMPFRNHSF